MILDMRSFPGIGAYAVSTTKAFPREGEQTELSKPEDDLVTWVAITGEVNTGRRQDELELKEILSQPLQGQS